MQQLHDSLLASSGGLKHAQVVGRQVASEVQQLERRLLVQERALGRYRRQQSMAKGSQRSENEALMALDHLWRLVSEVYIGSRGLGIARYRL